MTHFIALVLADSYLLTTPLLGEKGPSPGERKIILSRKAIERQPEKARPYNQLAMALARRARETADADYYQKGLEAVETSLRLEPGNYGARKARVWCLLGQHEFAKALEEAKVLNKLAPDDVQVYGFLADAYTELGEYEQAEAAVQWMLDLRPGNVPGLTRGAYLRELYGYTDAALEFLQKAYQRTAPSEVEDRAWILTHMAQAHFGSGDLRRAEQLLEQALDLFPDYHYALANLGKVRMGQERFAEAVDLFERRYERAPHPENLFDVAVALERAGRKGAAGVAFQRFETLGRAEMEGADNCNRELVRYYADYASRPEEALRIAQREIGRRNDVWTRDAHAWALHGSGDYEQARSEIEKALAPGIRDARLFYHAGMIAAKLSDKTAARSYLKRSLDTNPYSQVASSAREALSLVYPSTAFAPRRDTGRP